MPRKVITILINGHYVGEFTESSWLEWYETTNLEELLKEAVEEESYERAAEIRDEIKRREKK